MHIENRKWQVAGGLFVALGVILGALGAHALKSKLTEAALASFETGVKYQIYLGLFLMLLAVYPNTKTNRTVGLLSILGVFFFSFSIYGLSLQSLHGLKVSFLGPITPIGGLLMILALLMFTFGGLKNQQQR